MAMARINPGNIGVRLGKTLELYEIAVSESNLVVAANLIDVICDYISVHMTLEELEVYERMPGFAYGDPRQVHEVFQDLRARKRYVLGIAKKHNVFAWHQPDVGNSDALDEEDVAATAS